MKKVFFICTAVVFALAANAQMVKDSIWAIENYDWESTPQQETRAFITSKDEVIIKNVNLLEMRYEADETVLFELIHRKIWIGDESVIQRYNKLYLPINSAEDARTIKARVLLPNGNVVNLNNKDVQEGKDEDDNTYRYFALDGVQKGSIVEYLFLTKEAPSFMGTRYTLQRDAPIYDLQFELVVPYNLLFRVKSYNALYQAQEDTVLKYQNRYFIHQDTLPKFEKEPASYERAYMGYLIYALDRNLFSGKRDISSFGYSAANIYGNVHVPLDKKIEKAYKKILSQSEMANGETPQLKIARLENHLKENYFITKNGTQALYDLGSILETHTMSELGALRLYHTLFNYAGYPNELVFTSDKSSTPFDPDFENNLMITENLLYFPAEDVFMQPSNITSRLGYFDNDLHNTKALFVEGVDLGEGPEGIGEVRDIPAMKAKENDSELLVNWTLAADGELGKVEVEHIMRGMQTSFIQTISKYVPDADMDKYRKSILESYYGEVELQNVEIENIEGVNFPGKALIAKATFNDEAYSEPGSSSTVIKVGMIIGPQSEMYLTDSVRNLPVHHGFPKWYVRKIRLNVPEGYVLKNVESLAMDVQSSIENPAMGFTSTYSYKNNLLEIEINEWYEGGDYPAKMFEIYRNVINAAADFNKKYVVLELK